MKEVRLGEVFGISREVPLSYAFRDSVDKVFLDSLTRDKHVVVHGGSKQGKTCLRKHNLNDAEYIVVTCSNSSDLGQLHSAILKAAGYTVSQSTTKTVSGSQKIAAKLGAKVGVPGLVEVEVGAGTDKGKEESVAETRIALELDPSDVNDVIEALRAADFNKLIVLEDFHYLPDETQAQFAVALKAFHESSDLCFIVVGVWLDENRLIQYNGDLTGRVMVVNVDRWAGDELRSVVTNGEKVLNVKLNPAFVDGVVNGCYGSVYVLQEACYRARESSGIMTGAKETTAVGAGLDPTEVLRAVVDGESARYNDFITKFAEGFRETALEMYRWLLLPVLIADVDDLEHGISYNFISRLLKANHPEGDALNLGNVTLSLRAIASLQIGGRIKPLVLDYDQSRRRLNVVDRGFIIWLNYQDRDELLGLAGLPKDVKRVEP
jgi:hypothetical protein